jgi:hypothetical protein
MKRAPYLGVNGSPTGEGATGMRSHAAGALRARDFLTEWIVARPLLSGAIVVALAVRLGFWLGTGRTWEDALIIEASARNLWLGNGLVHHVTEPGIQSFTSPVSVFMPIIGESVGQGQLFARIVGLVAVIVTLIIADRLADHLGAGAAGRVLFLGYLALDQSHVVFGMVGMETQVATAVLLWSILMLFTRRWNYFGASLGIALYCRPDFLLWVVIGGVVLLVGRRLRALVPLGIGAAIIAPWLVFTWAYYGSPVPQTITAKNLYPWAGLDGHSLAERSTYLMDLWTSLSPYYSWLFTIQAPLPKPVGIAIALLVVGLSIAGLVSLIRRGALYAMPAVLVILFAAYLVAFMVPRYFMWYLPPFTAVLMMYSASGLEAVRRRAGSLAGITALGLIVLYALPLPSSFVLERRVQQQIEDVARIPTGQYLDRVMKPGQAALVEPLGFIGIQAFNKTIMDYPGLASARVTDALEQLPQQRRNQLELVRILRPDYLAFRPHELGAFEKLLPAEADKYREVARFTASPDLSLSKWGHSYFNIDTAFVVLHRRSGA